MSLAPAHALQIQTRVEPRMIELKRRREMTPCRDFVTEQMLLQAQSNCRDLVEISINLGHRRDVSLTFEGSDGCLIFPFRRNIRMFLGITHFGAVRSFHQLHRMPKRASDQKSKREKIVSDLHILQKSLTQIGGLLYDGGRIVSPDVD